MLTPAGARDLLLRLYFHAYLSLVSGTNLFTEKRFRPVRGEKRTPVVCFVHPRTNGAS